MARPRKISESQLLDIINKYIQNHPYVSTLKYSDLVRYAKSELGYKDITYQDFSRNNKAKEFVEIHKQRKDMTTYIKLNKDKLERFNFDVDTLVGKYENNPKQLKAVLKVFKEAYDKSFDLLSNFTESDSKNLNIIKEQEKFIEDLKKENKDLRNEINIQKEANSGSYRMEKLKWMYLLLKDMITQNNYYIETEGEIVDILKNFGYTSNDIVDVKKIIEDDFSQEKTNNTSNSHKIEEDSCSAKDDIDNTDDNVTPLRKTQLKLPNFMVK